MSNFYHNVEGKIVPAEITVRLLRNAMEKSGSSKFLVDGFPRDMSNLQCWEENMASIVDLQFLLFLDCPQVKVGLSLGCIISLPIRVQDIMLDRLLERGKTSGRNDDNEESIR